MKLRLPLLLKALLLNALISSSVAYSYTNDALLAENQTKNGNGAVWSTTSTSLLYSSYSAMSFLNNSASGYGGAIYLSDSGNSFYLSLTDSGVITFTGNTAQVGGAIYTYGGYGSTGGLIRLNNNTSVVFSKNKATNGKGGAIMADTGGAPIELKNNGNITISENTATQEGGAVYLGRGCGTLDVSGNTGEVRFEKNVSQSIGGAIASDAPGSIVSGGARFAVLFSGNHDISFVGNISKSFGGAIAQSAGVAGVGITKNTGTVLFDGNESQGSSLQHGGAVYVSGGYAMLDQNAALVFQNNKTNASGGGIYAYAGVSLTGNGSVRFEGNEAGWGGSGLAGGGLWLDISGNGAVTFTNNKVQGFGGALYTAFTGNPASSIHRLSADGGDITFNGNLCNVANPAATQRVAIEGVVDYGKTANFVLRAQESRSVNFYDAVIIGKNLRNGSDYSSSLTVKVNNADGYTGNILFSGVNNDGKVLTSKIAGGIDLFRGTLTIEDKAQVILKDIHTTQFGGGGFVDGTKRHDFYAYGDTVLAMKNQGSLDAGKVYLQESTVLRTGTGASVVTGTLDITGGMTFDLNPFIGVAGSVSGTDDAGNDINGTSGLHISADQWVMNGGLGILHLSDTLDFSGDDRWSKDQRFLLLVDENGTRGGVGFDSIVSNATGTNYIGEGYAYKGTWTYEWVGNSLYAVWEREQPIGGELWWDGQGSGTGNGLGVWNQDTNNKVWNLDAWDGPDFGFQDYDVVHFTRSGEVTIQGFVEFGGNVRPSKVIDVHFNEGKGDLIWKGPGSIVGTASMEKYGTGTLVIQTENGFTGGTTMYGGTIKVETLTGLGKGDVKMHAGHLDLGDKGVRNDIYVVKEGSIAGTASGEVYVQDNATLTFRAGTSFYAHHELSNLQSAPVYLEGKSTINIQAGSTVISNIEMMTPDAVVNFVAGNGGTSLLGGAIYGAGTINILGGNHQVNHVLDNNGFFHTGTLNIYDGHLTLSSLRNYGQVNLLGGKLSVDHKVSIDSLTVGSDDDTERTVVSFTDDVPGQAKSELIVQRVEINRNSLLELDGILDIVGTEGSLNGYDLYNEGEINFKGEVNISGKTFIDAGALIHVQENSVVKSYDMVFASEAKDGKAAGQIIINDSCAWNANGGFDVHYIDARTGHLTLGANSVVRENGYFYAENIVYGTDSQGNLLTANTPIEELPILTIMKGATFWAGNTMKHAPDNDGHTHYETQTGFENVVLDIDALVTIGTFVIKADGDGDVVHSNIIESMRRAFEPKLIDGEDQRTYLYVLKQGVNLTADVEIKHNETVVVESQADAVIHATSGLIINEGGILTVDKINTEGTVVLRGGNSNLVLATPDSSSTILGIGSFSGNNTDATAAHVKLSTNQTESYSLVMDTAQVQVGETLQITSNAQVRSRNFHVSGETTQLINEGGALVVDQEVQLNEGGAYVVGSKDRFGFMNLNKGRTDIQKASWTKITLGSYSDHSGESLAKIRLNEGELNELTANELTIIQGEVTNVTEGNTVTANILNVVFGSDLNVTGNVNVKDHLVFEAGVQQQGTIHMIAEAVPVTLDLFEELPVVPLVAARRGDIIHPPAQTVTLSGDNHVGIIDSSATPTTFRTTGFNILDGYHSNAGDVWVFTLTDSMLEDQNPENALDKIIDQSGNALHGIIVDTSQLTKSYYGDIQLYSDNITLTSELVDYGEAVGTYNQKDAIKNFRFENPVIPEIGTIMINSLWTMVSAMDMYSSAISGQLDLSPYRQHLSRNIWAKGLYLNENIGNRLPGYRKDSGGYAVGTDTLLNEKNLIGVSFAQMLGTEYTRRGLAKDKQDILMSAVYGRTLFESCPMGATSLDYMVGYGYGHNEGTFFRNDKYSTSSWNSNVYNAEMKFTQYRKVGKNVNVNPFVGIELIAADHDAHFIRGGAGDFEVGRSKFHALRLPIGASMEYVSPIGEDSFLTPYIGASYVPDVIRRNPSATVANGMAIKTIKDVNVGRNAVRAQTGCTWQIDRAWTVNLHYEVEAATQKVNQSARITTSYSY